MVSVGNQAKLVSSEQCQRCAKCCKTFSMSADINLALRFLWMESEDIRAKDTPFYLYQDMREATVCFNNGCSQLVEEDGVYRCKAWKRERPDFCNTYPDHCFWHIPEWNREHIEKVIAFERERCPGLENVTVNDVVAMLEDRRRCK